MKLFKLLSFLSFFIFIVGCGTTQQAADTIPPTQTSSAKKDLGQNYLVWNGSEFVEETLDEKPDFSEGSYHGYYTSLYKQIRYPVEAREKGVGGTVLIEVIVNEFGQMEAARVKEGIGAGCDEESLKIVRLISSRGFTSAIKDGIPVKVKFSIPVKFSLE